MSELVFVAFGSVGRMVWVLRGVLLTGVRQGFDFGVAMLGKGWDRERCDERLGSCVTASRRAALSRR